ncbi:nicotinamide riboside transporter PnuC [Pseudoalteromonas sp. T1lg22]|uniref:nicotinamide riboside transporter PnuC n=1 Tax=Pseudoalteromonas sp. T1lg22 TaxID=2077096 RepID=UPI000CF6F896|nr:nicotinamide riboside transporter PnuC [Pseudoalteromonas sp. T1lg22]
MDALNSTLSGFAAMSGWEYAAVALSVAYLLLAMRESLWCWPAAFFSTLIYTLMYWQGALLMESLLHFYYMGMAIYGWWAWRYGKERSESQGIVSYRLSTHAWLIIATTLIAVCIGYVMDNYTRADYAYLDSLTTCFAVLTTYFVAKKVLENWLYWVVIDAASIYLYLAKGYYPTVVLFVFYTFMAIAGYLRWRQQYQQKEQGVPAYA